MISPLELLDLKLKAVVLTSSRQLMRRVCFCPRTWCLGRGLDVTGRVTRCRAVNCSAEGRVVCPGATAGRRAGVSGSLPCPEEVVDRQAESKMSPEQPLPQRDGGSRRALGLLWTVTGAGVLSQKEALCLFVFSWGLPYPSAMFTKGRNSNPK